MLLEMGQSHLFEHWPDPGVDDDEKRNLLNQASFRNSSFLFIFSYFMNFDGKVANTCTLEQMEFLKLRSCFGFGFVFFILLLCTDHIARFKVPYIFSSVKYE